MSSPNKNVLTELINNQIKQDNIQSAENLEWLEKEMHPLFFSLNRGEITALSTLAQNIHHLKQHHRMMLLDTPKRTIIAQLDTHSSLYKTLQDLPGNEISYAELTTSRSSLPNVTNNLEVLRFDYESKQENDVAELIENTILPESLVVEVTDALKEHHPNFLIENVEPLLKILWCNKQDYVQVSPARRVARVLNLYANTELNDGIFLDLQPNGDPENPLECRLLFGVANPPMGSYLLQLLEVFNRFEISVNRSYSLTLNNGIHPYFLSTFYVVLRDNTKLDKDSNLYRELRQEIYNTQILSPKSKSYKKLVKTGVSTGPDASLINAIISFCHTNLAHNHPDSFSLEGIMRSFHNHPEMATQLISLFHSRFNPLLDKETRKLKYERELESATLSIENFNSGRKYLDGFRRTIFQCALSFIKHTLKTNYYVAEKHALAFRLDPIYLEDLDESFTEDLPIDRPYRITFFFGRNGIAYHIGFSDIARGGWRTIITQGRDNYITSANTMLKENYVLAHTQHLKNKDIYEGGSKMVAVLRASRKDSQDTLQQKLYKLQFSFIDAFFDLFVTKDGHAKDVRIVDYYGEDEPIELGPDENMHDVMIETIAKQGIKRGYILGQGVISSKQIGINHKEYGVTSFGVMRFAEVTMSSIGIDMHKDEFSVKFTGGPNGDVAGNCMRLIQERCPKAKIKLIIDGSGALFDPEGLDNAALNKVVLKSDLDKYNPEALHVDGFILYRNQTQLEGITTLYKRLTMTDSGILEDWVSTDQFYKTFNGLLFTVQSDLFIPAGGRPETIDCSNVARYFDDEGNASANVIVEGANSFITPDARLEMQRQGIIIIRDASANKCGVTSSSYEIIANLMLSDDEFLANKDAYVSDVMTILNDMAEREAKLILKRHKDANGATFYTDISNEISREINTHYDRIFDYFQANPGLVEQEKYQNALLLQLPKLIGSTKHFRNRAPQLPEKVKYAILASKLSSTMVYEGDDNSIYGGMIDAQIANLPILNQQLPAEPVV